MSASLIMNEIEEYYGVGSEGFVQFMNVYSYFYAIFSFVVQLTAHYYTTHEFTLVFEFLV